MRIRYKNGTVLESDFVIGDAGGLNSNRHHRAKQFLEALRLSEVTFVP